MNTKRERRKRRAPSSAPSRRPKKDIAAAAPIPWLAQCIWPFIGLMLTIFSTFFQASVIAIPADWGSGLSKHYLGVTYQVGAVLLTGCLAGRDAAIVAQIAYLILGLTSMSVFAQGGGLDYWREPSFGYILGFVPGAGLCGWLAFRKRNSLENLAISAFCGLVVIHIVGIIYLILISILTGSPAISTVPELLRHYSFLSLPGQFVIICITALISFLLRSVLFY